MRESEKTGVARRLRRNGSDVESKLWRRLRGRAVAGCKFRRQHPIGPFVVDFACLEVPLVAELDGGQHDRDEDACSARTCLLQARRFRVLRFWNNEVSENLDGVLATIAMALEEER